jgi:hypothetical protein
MKASFPIGILAALLCAGAWSAGPPVPKVMSDAPTTPGAWRMEMPGMDKAAAAQIGGGMIVCQTAAEAMSREERKQEKSRPDCDVKLIEDSATRAVMEMRCPDPSNRITITRVAPRSYELVMQDLARPSVAPMRMKLTYTGPCTKSDSAISLDKDSPACRQMRAQLPEIDKSRASCAKAGANRASCEQMVERQRAQISSMCGP